MVFVREFSLYAIMKVAPGRCVPQKVVAPSVPSANFICVLPACSVWISQFDSSVKWARANKMSLLPFQSLTRGSAATDRCPCVPLCSLPPAQLQPSRASSLPTRCGPSRAALLLRRAAGSTPTTVSLHHHHPPPGVGSCLAKV